MVSTRTLTVRPPVVTQRISTTMATAPKAALACGKAYQAVLVSFFSVYTVEGTYDPSQLYSRGKQQSR